jgi:hypothetical protein
MNRGKATLVYFCISAAFIAALCVHANAQIVTAQEFSGRATGINSTITTNGTASTAVTGDTCPLPPRGGTSTVTTSGILIPGTLASGTIVSSTSGSGITSQSSSSVSGFILRAGGFTVTATNVSSSTQCNCCDIANPGCSGQASVTGLTVTDPSGTNVPVTVTGAANQTVTIAGAGTITFNERIAGPGALTVNGMHINFTFGGTVYNVVVASSYSDILCPGIVVTPAEVNISGRVIDQNGAGVSRVNVTVSNTQGTVVRSATTGLNGQYLLTGVTVGQTYIVSGTHPSYVIQARSINLLDELTGFDLLATPR